MSPENVLRLELRPFEGFETGTRDYRDSALLAELFEHIESQRSIDAIFSGVEFAKKNIAREISAGKKRNQKSPSH